MDILCGGIFKWQGLHNKITSGIKPFLSLSPVGFNPCLIPPGRINSGGFTKMPYFAVIKVIIKITARGLERYPFQISNCFKKSTNIASNKSWKKSWYASLSYQCCHPITKQELNYFPAVIYVPQTNKFLFTSYRI